MAFLKKDTMKRTTDSAEQKFKKMMTRKVNNEKNNKIRMTALGDKMSKLSNMLQLENQMSDSLMVKNNYF